MEEITLLQPCLLVNVNYFEGTSKISHSFKLYFLFVFVFPGDEAYQNHLLNGLTDQLCQLNSTINALGICSLPARVHRALDTLENTMAQLCSELEDENLPCAYLHGDVEIGFVPRSETAEAAAYADETVRPPSSAGSAYDAAEKDNETAEKERETATEQHNNRETATPETQVRMTTRKKAETEKKKKILEAKKVVAASVRRNKQEIYEEMCARDPLIRIFGSYDKWYHNEMRARKAKTIADFKRNRPHSEYATVIDENFKQGGEMTEAEKQQMNKEMFKPDTVEEEQAKRRAAETAAKKAAEIAERAAEKGKARGLLYVSRQERMHQAGVNIPEMQPQTPPVQMFGNRGNVSINIGSPLSPGGSFYETAHSPSKFRESAHIGETASPKLDEPAGQKHDDDDESELNTAILHETESLPYDSDQDSHYSPTKDQEEEMEDDNDSVMEGYESEKEDDSDCMVISPQPKRIGAKVKTTQKVKPSVVKEEEEEGRRKRRASSNMENLKEKLKAEKVIYQKKIKREREEERKKQQKKKIKGGKAGKLLSLLKDLITDDASSDEDDEPTQVSDEALIDLCTNKRTQVIDWERFYQEKERMQTARRNTGYKKQKRKRSSDDDIQIIDSDDETAKPKKKKEKTAKKPGKTAVKTEEDEKTASEEILDLSDQEQEAQKKRRERHLQMTKLKHQCQICQKKFRSPSELKEHQKQHSEPDGHPWKCPCGKGFKWERGLIEHQRKGKCDVGKEKLQQGDLAPLEEELQCDFCEQTRPRKDLLEEHISKDHKQKLKEHGEKPKKFKCGKCGQKFYSWNSADQHIKRDTCSIKKKLDCKLCKIKDKKHQCMSEENLQKHLKKNHHREMMKVLEVLDSGAAKMIKEKVKPALLCVKEKCHYSVDELYKWISHIQLHHQERFISLLTDIFGEIFSDEPSSSSEEE